VTEVIGKHRAFLSLIAFAIWAVLPAFSIPPQPSFSPAALTAESLYAQLSSVGLDPSRVFRIRDYSLDRADLHITFEDGTIAFTQDVAGRVTGAFFEGEGEVLLPPPTKGERASMALFTGSAILEERFITAYFRFNDDTFADMQPSLRPTQHTSEYVSEWGEAAKRLASVDALRLFVSFSRLLPEKDAATPPLNSLPKTDQILHARLQGRKLGTFDLFYDSTVSEQIWAGQPTTVEGITYYDLWTSFATTPDPPAGKPSPPRREVVAISHYDIKAEVKPPTTLNADVTLNLEVRQGGDRTLLFELSRFLPVKSVELNGRPIDFIHNQAVEGTQLARRGNDLVAVVFPEPLRAGDKFQMHFVYGGEVLSEAGKGLLYVGARGTWYPNRGLAMAGFNLEFRYPLGWILVATGKRLTDEPPSGAAPPAGQQVSRWVSERPIPVAGFNLGKYVHASAHAGEVLVEAYATAGMERSFKPEAPHDVLTPSIPISGSGPAPLAPPPPPVLSPAKNAQPVADQSARAIDFFVQRFGPFPYSSLKLTQMPGDLSQGWPGLVFLSSYVFLTPEEKKELHVNPLASLLSAQVLTHETAHMWWGDLITWSTYRDQWMFEGLSNYCALMKLESENPKEFHQALEKYRLDLLQKNKDGQVLQDAGPVSLGVRLSSSRFPEGYEAVSYGRGTWLFHMLREMMRDAEAKKPGHAGLIEGEEPFVRSLRRVREKYEGAAISTRDLLQVFAEDLPPNLRYEGQRSLDWFLDGWVNGTSMPRYSTRNVSYSPKANATVVAGTLLQKDAPNDLVTAVPIYAVSGKTTTLLGQVLADGPETTFHFVAPAGTRKIEIDPYQTILVGAR
jgi:hypothetical protein